MFLGIYPFHPGCPVCWHRVVHVFLQFWYFRDVSCYISSLISNFIYLGPHSFFFFMHLVRALSISLTFSKNQLLVSSITCIDFFSLYVTYFCPNLYYFLLMLGFVCCSFSSSFSCEFAVSHRFWIVVCSFKFVSR